MLRLSFCRLLLRPAALLSKHRASNFLQIRPVCHRSFSTVAKKDPFRALASSLEVAKEALTELGPQASVNDWNMAMSIALANDQTSAVTRMFHDVKDHIDPNLCTFELMIDAMSRDNNVKGMIQIYNMMKQYNISPSPLIVGIVIQTCTRLSKFSDALSAYADGEQLGYLAAPVDTLDKKDPRFPISMVVALRGNTVLNPFLAATVSLIIYLIQTGHQLEANNITKQIHDAGVPIRSVVSNSVVVAFANSSRLGVFNPELVRWLDEMDDRFINLDPSFYAIACDAYLQAPDRTEKWQSLFKDIRASSLPMSNEIYNRVLAYYIANDVHEALAIHEEFLEKRGRMPNSQNCQAIIDTHAKAANPRAAMRLYVLMERYSIEALPRTHACLLESFSRAGDFPGCLAVKDMLIGKGAQLNEAAYNNLIDACGFEGDMGTLEGLWKECREAGMLQEVNVYTSMVEACCRLGSLSRGAEIALEMITRTNLVPTTKHAHTFAKFCLRSPRADIQKLAHQFIDSGDVPLVGASFVRVKERDLTELEISQFQDLLRAVLRRPKQ